MKRKIAIAFLFLFTFSLGGYFGRAIIKDAWAAIQSEVGINVFDITTGSWVKASQFLGAAADNQVFPGGTGAATIDVDAIMRAFNGTGFDRVRTAGIGDGQPQTGILASQSYGFNGTTYDRIRSLGNNTDAIATSTLGLQAISSFPFAFNGTTYDRLVTSGDTRTTGSLAVNEQLFNGTNYNQSRAATADAVSSTGNSIPQAGNMLFNNSTWDRRRGISASNLTATTSSGSTLSVPLSTWSVTSTPAAATQATASKASGGGTVRHVATTITACLTDTDSAQAGTVHLRDGATGAGTILRTWYLHIPAANESKCVDLSGLAMIGTAATAMTLEFTAAGTANSLETVTLTGFSVP